MPFINKYDLVASLTKEDVIKICKNLGSDYRKDSQGNLIFNTSICKEGGDSWKLYYYHDPDPMIPNDRGKRFVCYTTGEKFDIVELVIRNFRLKGNNLTYFQALSYLANETGFVRANVSEIKQAPTVNDMGWINSFLSHKNSNSVIKPSVTNENVLEVFSYIPIRSWESEGISLETQQKYEISYFPRDNAIVIPHRDQNGGLIGIRKRNLDPEQVKEFGKYNFVTIEDHMYKFRLGTNLYGLNRTKEAINRIGKIIIFEAEKSVLMCDTFYGDNSFAVATCGSNLTYTQIQIIKSLKVREVFLAYDKEFHDANSFEAEAYKNKLIKELMPLMPYADCYLVVDTEGLTDYKDAPVDKGKEIFSKILKNKILVTYQMVADLKAKAKETNNYE